MQINRVRTGARGFQNGADAGRCRLIVVVARPRRVGFLRCPALGERLTRERVERRLILGRCRVSGSFTSSLLTMWHEALHGTGAGAECFCRSRQEVGWKRMQQRERSRLRRLCRCHARGFCISVDGARCRVQTDADRAHAGQPSRGCHKVRIAGGRPVQPGNLRSTSTSGNGLLPISCLARLFRISNMPAERRGAMHAPVNL